MGYRLLLADDDGIPLAVTCRPLHDTITIALIHNDKLADSAHLVTVTALDNEYSIRLIQMK
jgi:hypothetical protein